MPAETHLDAGLSRAIVRIRDARRRGGMSLADVAESSGLTRAAISRLENGRNLNPTFDTLRRYAVACGLELRLVAG